MPTNKQRREAARRHLERQLERRQEREARRKKATLIISIVATVVLIAVVVAVIVVLGSGGKKTPAAASKPPSQSQSPSPTTSPTPTATRSPLPSRAPSKIASRAAKKTTGPCGYAESATALKQNPNLFDVGLPPDPKRTPTASRTVVFHTNRGDITAVLDGKGAPCNVQSLVYLISKKFYDHTACPRSVNKGIYVVQCGDPSATTGGGPTYTTKDENLAAAKYTTGTIAMANSGKNTNSSQFFFITKDSSKTLGKNYTVVGHITKGLAVLQKVAAAGDDGSNQAGGGRPNLDLIFRTVTVGK